MATYKVLQDIEAEDKLVGPFTLWQFIYLFVTGVCVYLSVVSIMKNVPVFLILLVPVILFAGFLAVPWGGDQPTEVWALAKLRFMLKPRRRIWNQDGMTELVSITVPKRIEQFLTDGLSQHEVRSRLSALASTLDSRGWAVKNVNVNLSSQPHAALSSSDRLVDVSNIPQEVSAIDVRPGDDILDETANSVAHNFDTMIDAASSRHRQKLVEFMNQPVERPAAPVLPPVMPMINNAAPTQTEQSASVPAAQWFVPPAAQVQPVPQAPMAPPVAAYVPQAAVPTAAEEALAAHIRAENDQQDNTYSHLQTIKTPEQLEEEAAARQAAAAARSAEAARMTSEKQAAIMNLARNNDRSVATLEKDAQKINGDEEVVISLR